MGINLLKEIQQIKKNYWNLYRIRIYHREVNLQYIKDGIQIYDDYLQLGQNYYNLRYQDNV